MGLNILRSIEGLSQFAAAAFVSSLWQGVLLAVAVALGLRLVPKMTAAVRFAVWSAVFVVILLLPLIQAWVSRSHTGIASSGAGLQLDVRWSYAIAAVWMVFSLARATKLAISGLRLHGLWKRATPVPADMGSVLSGTRGVQLCTSTEIDRPSVIGFFSPRILIPAWLFEKLTPAELEQIVIHEAGHISRADDWINLFQKIGLALFPLNPVLMWIDRRLCFERELACDDGVLDSTHAPGAYASCLVSLAERSKDRRAVLLSLGAWERQSELTRRVHSILRRRESMSPLQMRLASGGMVIALLGAGIGLSQCPHLVSFTEVASLGELSAPISAGAAARIVPMSAKALPAATLQPAVFHPAASPHETLLKASLPSRPALKPARSKARKAPAVTPPAVIPAVSPAPAASPVRQASTGIRRFVVLASAPVDPSGRPGVVLAVSPEHAYAALPTEDGWLVIQL
jgi:beta-lactamase regulating signal transducer with metallopeptidase domain